MGLYVSTSIFLISQFFSTSLNNDRFSSPTWKVEPEILICHNSHVSSYRVEKAARFWKNLGHPIGKITKAQVNNYDCAVGIPQFGVIMIDIPSQDFQFGEHLGLTKTWWRTDTGEILKSKIEIGNGSEETERILEHELGHALGFKDNSETGHMMNGSWNKGGFKKKGLQRNNP